MRRSVSAGILLALAMTGSAAAQNAGLTGYWRGTYVCAQGLTGINLTIRQGLDSDVEAIFHFYAVPQNPDVPSGCFRMSGRLDPATRAFSLTSDDSRWIVRPPDYIVVDFHGSLGAEGRSMRGRVDGPGCTEFELQRLEQAPPAPLACSDALILSSPPPQGGPVPKRPVPSDSGRALEHGPASR